MKFTINELHPIKVVICFWLFIFDSCIAEVIYSQYPNSQAVTIRIEKEITSKDLIDFKYALNKLDESQNKLHLNSIVLDSNGGDGEIARDIGKLIRARNFNTYLAEDSDCSSACVYVLIGGVQRYAFGNVRVHRTTFMYDSDTDEHVEKFIKENQKIKSEYIKSMGISLLLSEAMESTSSWDIRQLTELEKKQWQVFGFDRLTEELYINQTARARHISRNEFIDIFKSNYDYCLRDAREFKQTVFDCAKSKKFKEQNYYTQFLKWLMQKIHFYMGSEIDQLPYSEQVQLLRKQIRNGTLYNRYTSITEVTVPNSTSSVKRLDFSIIQRMESANKWWVEGNKLSVFVLNPTKSELKEVFFELSSTDCKTDGSKKRLLYLSLHANLEANNSAIYSGELPFNYDMAIGKGTRCGVIKDALIVTN